MTTIDYPQLYIGGTWTAPAGHDTIAVHSRATAERHGDPVGVVGAMLPWNVPQGIAFLKLAPALAAGCTIVLKPAEETVLDAFLMAEAAAAAGLPDGVVNVVPARPGV